MHVSTRGPDVEGIQVTVNPGSGAPFATVDLGGRTEIVMHGVADADMLILAAVTAKRRLEGAIAGALHEWVMAPEFSYTTHCDACGLLEGNAIHAGPRCEAVQDDVRCTEPARHGGHHYGPDAGGGVRKMWLISDSTIAQARYFEEHPLDEELATAADVAAYRESVAAGYCTAHHPRDGVACAVQGPHDRHAYVPFAARDGAAEPVTWTDADMLGHAIDNKLPVVDEDVADGSCGHEFELGGIAYQCERAPHPIDGYDPAYRHAASIDENHAEHTDSGDGEADLMTWGEDSGGDGQDWDVAWGTVASYGTEGGQS